MQEKYEISCDHIVQGKKTHAKEKLVLNNVIRSLMPFCKIHFVENLQTFAAIDTTCIL